METTQNQVQTQGRAVLLNALPLNALPRSPLRLRVQPLRIEEIGWYVQGRQVVHFIRHQSTIDVLRTFGIPVANAETGLYRYQQGDRLIVITLRTPIRGSEQANVAPADLEAWLVEIEEH